MPNHQPPAFRFLTKESEDGPLKEIGTVWLTSKKDVFSVSLDLEDTGEPVRFLMVPNTAKTKKAVPKGQRPTA